MERFITDAQVAALAGIAPYVDGYIEYNGFKIKIHDDGRIDFIWPDGTFYHFLRINGEILIHNENGPAVKWSDGPEEWWENGRLIRCSWWINGKRSKI